MNSVMLKGVKPKDISLRPETWAGVCLLQKQGPWSREGDPGGDVAPLEPVWYHSPAEHSAAVSR